MQFGLFGAASARAKELCQGLRVNPVGEHRVSCSGKQMAFRLQMTSYQISAYQKLAYQNISDGKRTVIVIRQPRGRAQMSSKLGTLEELPQDYRDAMGRETAAYLVRIHDTPLQEKLGYYEERAR